VRSGLVLCGDIDTVSGGFLYDRMLVDCLQGHGDTVDILPLPWQGYPQALRHHGDARIRDMLLSWRGDILIQDELAHASLHIINDVLRSSGIPLVSIVHHLWASEGHGKLCSRAHVSVEKAYLRSVDGFVFNSHTTRQVVESLLGAATRGVVATPGGDRLGPGPSEEEIARRCAEPGPLRILFVGAIIPRKSLQTLVEALGLLPADQWLLTIAGPRDMDPSCTARIEAAIAARGLEQHVVWTGALGDAPLAQALRTHHVLGVPSRYEGFGIVTLEAMGFGVVPIATRAGGTVEIVDEESGILFSPGNVRALARALAGLARDRARLQSLARGSLRRFRSFAGWRQSMETAREFLLLTAERGGA
jgi:glycosyltransferase involved in cell wall biosynthesis